MKQKIYNHIVVIVKVFVYFLLFKNCLFLIFTNILLFAFTIGQFQFILVIIKNICIEISSYNICVILILVFI